MINFLDSRKKAPGGECRFEFGKNWRAFLMTLTEERIQQAERSLLNALQRQDLKGLSFLDIGSGSGLFSLAARRLGARVYSFDYDLQSVACAVSLKERYFKDDPAWTVEQGSALDYAYLKSLGRFDIVYSWGVLHHTGDMWRALELASRLSKTDGYLFISIYNDQGRASQWWKAIKKIYNTRGRFVRGVLISYTFFRCWALTFIRDLIKTGNFLLTWRSYRKNRGMSAWHDIIDWVGGYPFEVAKPEEIFNFFKKRGFELTHLKTCAGGLGCNEYVFLSRGRAFIAKKELIG